MEEQGFTKIQLPSEQTVQNQAAAAKAPVHNDRSGVKKLLFLLAVIVGIGIVLGLLILIPAKTTIAKAKEVVQAGHELKEALKTQDLNQIKGKITLTKKKLTETKSSALPLSWIRIIPVAGSYYADFDHGVSAGLAGLDALEISVDSIAPYADLLGLKGKGTFTGGTANERLQTAITTFEKVTPKLSEISSKLEIVNKEINAIDANRYPEKYNGQPIRENIQQAKSVLSEVSNLFISARPLLEDLPSIMGHPGAKKYLVFFKNDKELRPDGGFITAYAIFRMENGKPIVEKADDIYKLDDSRTKKVAAPPEILKYHKNVFFFNLRDSNLSPDFSESLKKFESLYQDVPGKIDYDGVLTVDTHVLVEAMKILGTFVVYDREFNADNDSRCDCPKVVYQLEDYSTKPVAYVRSDRKDIIGVLLLQVMQKALGISPSQYWGRLFQMGIKELNEKHILINLKDTKAQESIEKLEWAGRIKPFTGDYLHINDANMAGAKSDLFVKRSAKIEYTTGQNGQITKTITIDYKNPTAASNCNLEAGQLCLNGLLRNWVRLYVPKGSKLVNFKGSELDPVVKEDLDKTVFEGFLTVKPQGASQLVIQYTLPDGLKKGNILPFLIQKQPGTDNNEYQILVNGKAVDKFMLTTDREIQLKL